MLRQLYRNSSSPLLDKSTSNSLLLSTGVAFSFFAPASALPVIRTRVSFLAFMSGVQTVSPVAIVRPPKMSLISFSVCIFIPWSGSWFVFTQWNMRWSYARSASACSGSNYASDIPNTPTVR